uniref:NADH-ubiquinone oxidoreductase chain 6 n=1 Tax=Conger myriaster TaxID=7943 RepID=Q95A13_CONMY|nr:NADH dehydrogenase subunit 6 [Conger myriaster]QUJ09878.1 NADH dehydrogenase subunit 6 [Conger myriaster]BAB47004.1 NADH dehydrogenase subunits 6 [Conger myriaster]
MMLFIVLFLVLMTFGAVCVSCNPSPFYSIFGLVLSTLAGCMMLASYGGTFVSLILFLIYLGGMLVAFVFCVAVASEAYLEGLESASVLVRFVLCLLISFIFCMISMPLKHFCGVVDEHQDLSPLRGDFAGVSMIYGPGGGMLMACGWALFLSLFVVLELTRGRSLGALRSI